MNTYGFVPIAFGVIGLCGAFFEWDWFYDCLRVRILVKLFGRIGTRIFYGVLGFSLVAIGVLMTMGVLS